MPQSEQENTYWVQKLRQCVPALKKAGGRHAHRDSTLILLIYRHGLRVAEASALLLGANRRFVAVICTLSAFSQGTPSTHPLYGDEIRSLRKLQRDYPTSAYIFQSSRQGPLAKDTIAGIIERAGELALLPFPVHVHMLRHACGYALAAKGVDTRTIQGYLGHNNIQHTVRYTELSLVRFKGLWDE